MKKLIIFVPLVIFFIWVVFYKVPGVSIWGGLGIAMIWVIALGLFIIPPKTCQRYDMFGYPKM